MEYRVLGSTGLRVSVMGVGSGGPSQLGQNSGVGESDVRRMIRRALDLGINFFDTSAAYGESEGILGRCLRDVPRDAYVLATKFHAARDGVVKTADEIRVSLDRSLARLNVETLDLVQIHGVRPAEYSGSIEVSMPVLDEYVSSGRIRHIGITETYADDPRHEMLPRAIPEGLFGSAMVGYNLLSPTPEKVVLPMCARHRVGVIVMCAVRRALGRPDYLEKRIADAKTRGLIDPDALEDRKPLDWLLGPDVPDVPAAGYKYVKAHPAVSTVLTGTANIAHLEANVEAILGPPLPDAATDRLRSIFGDVWEPLGN